MRRLLRPGILPNAESWHAQEAFPSQYCFIWPAPSPPLSPTTPLSPATPLTPISRVSPSHPTGLHGQCPLSHLS